VYELGDWLEARGPLRVAVDVERRAERLVLRGEAVLPGTQPCGRCTSPAAVDLRAEILLLADRKGSDDPDDEAALEQEGSVLYHDGIELDLKEVLREALILEVPPVALCRPDCRGLCPRCGQDFNEGPCGCPASEVDPRWRALEGLRQEHEEP